jgi:hypothetical protein
MSFLALILLLCAGCSVLKREMAVPVDVEEIRFLEGETHYRTVLYILGPPGKVSTLTEGVSFLYEHARTDEKQLGIDLSKLGLPIIRWFKISFAKGRADREVLLLIFDDTGILQSQRFNSYKENLGGGAALQYFLTVAPLVDSSSLEDEIGPTEWGASLLRPLPETLNARQSLDTGDHGLEQDGTPTVVGQHTLELRR